MAVRPVAYALALLITFGKFPSAQANAESVRFQRKVAFDGLTCPAFQSIFSAKYIKSKSQCTLQCTGVSSCAGVFYQPQNETCVGCSSFAIDDAQTFEGMEFYGQVCGEPSDSVTNGAATLDNDNQMTYLDTATINCNEGYETIKTSIKCQANGDWESSTCEKKVCGNLPYVPNGAATLDNDNQMSYLDTATVNCDEWYETIKTSIKCQANGTWETSACELKDAVYKFNEKLYRFVQQEGSWDDAQVSCHQQNGSLVSIKSQEENDFIVATITAKYSDGCYWTGGRGIEGVFVWHDGTAFASSYTNWIPGEHYSTNSCVALVRRFAYAWYAWNDGACDYLCSFICEYI